jgi:hypothetical protein
LFFHSFERDIFYKKVIDKLTLSSFLRKKMMALVVEKCHQNIVVVATKSRSLGLK